MLKVGLIGFGAIGRTVVEHWDDELARLATLSAICVRPDRIDAARALVPPGTRIVTDVDTLMAAGPDLIVEAAGHGVVVADGARILRAGHDLYLLSVGALADERLRRELEAAAAAGDAQLCLPAGALAGFDGLLAQREQGLRSVRYTSTKPPHAWVGTVADTSFALGNLDRPTVIFEGSARDAARLYPKNANLAAAVALAGLGLDETTVRLVADPGVRTNIGLIEASGALGGVRVEVTGTPTDNPKTSAVTGMSVLASLRNHLSRIAFV